MWQIWLILAGIFIIFEMIIPTDFLIFWVGIAAGLTSVCSAFIDNITIQIVVFCISSILLIFCTKPFVRKFTKKDENVHTNAYSIIGRKGLVISDIDPISGKGQVKVDNEVWSAKTKGVTIIPKDTVITVNAIEGVKVIVSAEEKAEIKI
ncbi:MAG: NfeD family protein [Clostridia bacterium]|nr:NfeD family protein [Clostridia bacterium]